MANLYRTADADRLLGLADQFLDDWKAAADPKDRDGHAEVQAEWDQMRPLLVRAPALHALVTEAVDMWADRFAADEDINGGDLVEWFAGWLERAGRGVEGEQVKAAPASLPGAPGMAGQG